MSCCTIQEYEFKKTGDLLSYKPYCPLCKTSARLYIGTKIYKSSEAEQKFNHYQQNKLIKRIHEPKIESGSKSNLYWSYSDSGRSDRSFIRNFNNKGLGRVDYTEEIA